MALQEAYTTQELVGLIGIARQNVDKKAKSEGWHSRPRSGRGGGNEWLFSSMPLDTQKAVHQASLELAVRLAEEQGLVPVSAPVDIVPPAFVRTRERQDFSEEKVHVAKLKADLVRSYQDHLALYGRSLKIKEEFIALYESGAAYHYIYDVIGSVSWKTLERWKVSTQKADGVHVLADKRGLFKKGYTVLTPQHETIILGQVLHPNAPKVSQCARRIQAKCEEMGIFVPSEPTIRRFVNAYIAHCFDEFTLFTQGKKAWNDKCAISIMRDWSLVEVGDIVIADGHVLNFETLNPETGKPKRMTLLLFFDGASNHPLGWEIMASENIQCISSAFRRTCMCLGKIPRVVYIDNGRAFRAKFFEGSRDLAQVGISGLYESLGCKVVHAWPYHGQSKTIERFFGTMHEMEVFVPSYVGNNINNKPARLHRNEKLHQKLYEGMGGRPLTLEETHTAVMQWFTQYVNRPNRAAHLNGRTPHEVFQAGRSEMSLEDIERLDMLMMSQEVRTITKDGFRLNGMLFWDEALASRRHEILVRYDSVYSPHCVKVYTLDGQFLCDARSRERYGIAHGIHPAAEHLGTEAQKLAFEDAMRLKKRQERTSFESIKAMTESVIVPEAQAQAKALQAEQKRVVKAARPVEATPMTPEEVAAFEEAKAKALEKQRAKGEYTPSTLKRFVDSLDRYSYLFSIMYDKGLSLIEEDALWMQHFEQSEEYTRNHKRRFDKMRDFYKSQVG